MSAGKSSFLRGKAFFFGVAFLPCCFEPVLTVCAFVGIWKYRQKYRQSVGMPSDATGSDTL
jgi:hypothetical protein